MDEVEVCLECGWGRRWRDDMGRERCRRCGSLWRGIAAGYWWSNQGFFLGIDHNPTNREGHRTPEQIRQLAGLEPAR
jgi:hypothetical protein